MPKNVRVGDRRWFIYMCYEGHDSNDAELWYRTVRPVVVVKKEQDSIAEGGEWVQLAAYKVRFDDGFEYTAAEDELQDKTAVVFPPDKVRRTNPPTLGPDFRPFWNPERRRALFSACLAREGIAVRSHGRIRRA